MILEAGKRQRRHSVGVAKNHVAVQIPLIRRCGGVFIGNKRGELMGFIMALGRLDYVGPGQASGIVKHLLIQLTRHQFANGRTQITYKGLASNWQALIVKVCWGI